MILAVVGMIAGRLSRAHAPAEDGAMGQGDIYHQILAQYAADPAYTKMLAALTSAHQKIIGAADDPDWARPTERQLREALYADPAGAKLDIRSLACRKSGCEVQFFETNPSLNPADPPAWLQAVERLKLTDLGAAIGFDANFFWKSGNSVMFVMTFRRRSGSGDASP